MDNYREKVFNLIPSLRYLDGYEIIHWLRFVISFIFSKRLIVFCLFRYDADDCEVDSEGEDDEVNGNEDGEGGGNEEDSEEGWLTA